MCAHKQAGVDPANFPTAARGGREEGYFLSRGTHLLE